MEKSKDRKIFKSFNVIIFINIIILVAAIIIQITNESKLKLNDVISVVVTLVCGIMTILAITLSVTTRKHKNFELWQILKMRKRPYFSTCAIFIISILEIALIVFFNLIKLKIITCGLIIATVANCIYFIYQDVPILTNNQKRLNKIVIDYIKSDDTRSSQYQVFTNFLYHNIFEDKGLVDFYAQIKANDNDFKTLDKLLDYQETIIDNLKLSSDDNNKEKLIYQAIYNIQTLLKNKELLTKMAPQNLYEYTYRFTRIVFFSYNATKNTNLEKYVQRRIDEFINNIIFEIIRSNWQENEENYSNLLISIILNLVNSSIGQQTLFIMQSVNKSFSQNSNFLRNSEELTTLFDFISCYIYYVIKNEQNIGNFNITLKSWLTKSDEFEGGYRITSWENLVKHTRENYNVDWNLLKNNLKYCHYGVYLYNEIHSNMFNENDVANWYLLNLLNSEKVYEIRFKFQSYFPQSEKALRIQTEKLINYIKSNDLDRINDLYDFYHLSNGHFLYFCRNSEQIEELEELLNNYKGIDLENELKQNHQSCDSINQIIKNSFENYMNNYYGKKDIVLDENDRLNQKILLESTLGDSYYKDMAKNYADDVIMAIKKEFLSDESCLINCQERDVEDIIQELKNKQITYQSKYALDNLKSKDKAKNELIDNYRKEIKTLDKENFLSEYLVCKEDSIRFNFETNFSVNELSKSEIETVADSYKRNDGMYFYKGVLTTRDFVLNLIKNNYVVANLEVKARLEYQDVYVLDIWGFGLKF